ncbi:hypothetical protein J6590_094505, partial [Homalodisca vitripennis]
MRGMTSAWRVGQLYHSGTTTFFKFLKNSPLPASRVGTSQSTKDHLPEESNKTEKYVKASRRFSSGRFEQISRTPPFHAYSSMFFNKSVSATQECSFGDISADTAQFKINLYHQYIHGRHFDVEQRVCDLALNVTQDLISTFSRDLDALLTITSQIFKLFISLVKDRGGRGCVKELKESFQTISKKESKVFKSCMTLPFHKQVELKKEVVSFHNEYQNAFMRILARLDQCQSQFPNAADKDKLNGCVKSNHERYFKKVANIGQDHFNDSCMKVFVESIANCQAKSLDKVKSETSRLLKLLTNCALLFNADIDPKLKASAMSAEKQIVLVPSIEAQIKEAQSAYGNIKTDDALERFIDFMVKAYTTVLEDHPNGYYDKQFKKAMDSYLKAVDRSLRDNKHPQDTTCGRTALQRLNEIVKR